MSDEILNITTLYNRID